MRKEEGWKQRLADSRAERLRRQLERGRKNYEYMEKQRQLREHEKEREKK
jgi:hypothetical protein